MRGEMLVYGSRGKILYVDLSNSTIDQIDTQPYFEKYLGGRGIASRLYWEFVKPTTKAFAPENKIIFMTGLLVGVNVPACNRMSVISKSPMAFPEGYCYSNMGGFFGAELKKAGFDGIIIEGHSLKPVYLLINNNNIKLYDASFLWGYGVYKTGEILQQIHGNNIRYITIGIAGENLVRSAIIFGSHESTSMAGFGAVMGSKKLKAIAVKGNLSKPSVFDPDRLKELRQYSIKISRRVRLSVPPLVTMTGKGHLLEVIGNANCYQCPLACIKGLYRYGKKLEGYRRCQAMEYYLPWRYNKEDEPIETWFYSTTLANDYGIDTFELQSIIDWLYSCYRSKTLSEQETGLPLSKIGTQEFLEKLLCSIAYRKGFGKILAEGIIRASEKITAKARSQLSHKIAAIGQQDLAPARAIITNAILYYMEPRVHQPLIHEIGFVRAALAINKTQPNHSPVTVKTFYKIANTFWGSEEAGTLDSYEGKALAAKLIQNRTYIKDSLGFCDFAWPITYSFNTEDNVGDPELEAKIFSAVTGINERKLEEYADRIFNLQRVILLREGRRTPEEDFPPAYNFTIPLGVDGTLPVLVPRLGGETELLSGKTLDREKFKAILKEYYRLRGWDEETGLPRPETLTTLGLRDLLSTF